MVSLKIYDIFCIIELIINFVIVGCLSDEYIFGPVQHYVTNQFCHGGTYGMILVLLPLLYGLCGDEPRPKKTSIIVAATGAIVFVAAAVLMILEIEEHVKDKHKDQYNQLMAGAAITLVLGVIFLIHFITLIVLIKLKKNI